MKDRRQITVQGAVIDVEGEATNLETFLRAPVAEAPALARIECVATEGKAVQHYTTLRDHRHRTPGHLRGSFAEG